MERERERFSCMYTHTYTVDAGLTRVIHESNKDEISEIRLLLIVKKNLISYPMCML